MDLGNMKWRREEEPTIVCIQKNKCVVLLQRVDIDTTILTNKFKSMIHAY